MNDYENGIKAGVAYTVCEYAKMATLASDRMIETGDLEERNEILKDLVNEILRTSGLMGGLDMEAVVMSKCSGGVLK